MLPELGRQVGFWAAGAMRLHRNQGIEVCRIQAGRFRWSYGGRTWDLGPGDGYVTLPWQLHGGEQDIGHRGALDYAVIHLDRCTRAGGWRFGRWCALDRAAQAMIERTLLTLPGPLLPQAHGVGAAFDRLWDEVGPRHPGWIGQAQAILGDLLLAAARHAASPAVTGDDLLVRRALEVVASRQGEAWRLAAMAALVGLGRTRFAERCQAITGLSPRRWLLQQRLEGARQALRTSRRPITDLALDLGFATSQHFAAAFRRAYGTTPQAWRQAGLVPRRVR